MKKIISMVLLAMLLTLCTLPAFAAPGDSYNAFSQLDEEKSDGTNVPWQYMHSYDQGASFDLMPLFSVVDWGKYWYPEEGSYVGLGVNNDVPDRIEMNISDNNAELVALAFVAPNEGDFKITGSIVNQWAQPVDKFTILKGNENIFEGTIAAEEGALLDVDLMVSLGAGETLYFYATTAGGWVSVYADITVEEIGSAAEETAGDTVNPETGDPSTLTYILAALSGLAGIAVFSRKSRAK
jgi:hypothetical protein